MPDALDAAFSKETLIELGKLQIKMSRNPKIRAQFLRTVKAHDPNYTYPADVQIADLEDRLAAKDEQAKIDRETQEVRARLEAQRRGLEDGSTLRGHKFTPDQVNEIETVMTKYGIADYEAGAKIYASDLKPERPANGRPSNTGANWTFPEIEGLLEDPAAAARQAAYNVIDELRR